METNKRLEAPSKTFLVGEYAVLKQGPGLVLTTPPYFSLAVQAATQSPQQPSYVPATQFAHPDSPAGRLIQAHPCLHQYHYALLDPHQQQGGFGASSAQFLLLYQLLQSLIAPNQPIELSALHRCYQQHQSSNQGIPPSGADLIAQATGQLCILHNQQIDSLAWPFPTLAFCLIRTGKKLATHQHLASLPNLNVEPLIQTAHQTITAIKQQAAQAFCQAINQYAQQLAELHLTAPHTLSLIQEIKTHCPVQAIKGCGALGADVILAVVKQEQLASFKQCLQQLQLHLVYSGQTLATGSLSTTAFTTTGVTDDLDS